MARLPPVEVAAIWARDALNRGDRERGLELLAKAGDGPIARDLRASVARRGRQPFGAKHLWWDIGTENDILREQGAPYAQRLETLALKFRMNDEAKLKVAIAKYEAAMDEIRAINAVSLRVI